MAIEVQVNEVVYEVELLGGQGPRGATGPGGTLTDNNGFTASGPTVVKDDSAALFDLQQADGTSVVKVNSEDAFVGAGSATSGAPRLYFGTLTPSGDDSAICVGRDIVTAGGFDHAFRDESEFLSTGDSAYTGFDFYALYKDNGGDDYNHGYGFQFRGRMDADNGMGRFSGFVSFPIITAGTVAQLFHVDVQGLALSGTGVVTQQIGLRIATLAGAASNYAIFAEGNPSYLGGDLQIAGVLNGVTSVSASAEIKAGSLNVTAAIAAFYAGGGLVIAGDPGGYATIRAYADDAGAPRGLRLNPNAGQVLVGASSNSTGHQLEVSGKVYASAGLAVGNTAAATTPGTVARKMEVFDAAGTSLGFIAIYSAIT